MSNNKDFKVKNGIQPTVYHEGLGTVVSGSGPAYDLSSASYDGVSFSVAAQVFAPTDISFKPDGTKMYVLGQSLDAVNEYDLSTAWDITTASFLQSFSVASQETNPNAVFFKPDGTKMYITGYAFDNVNEYNLSTAWDISTASYLQSLSISARETSPSGLFFKPDGTKMYVTGDTGNDINEYNLSTAWDISTASYLQSFSVAAQETSPQGLFFKPDGLSMYIMGNIQDATLEYSLGTAWDVSSASYLRNFGVTNQDTLPIGVSFKNDGTKMYVVGATNDAVYQYSTVLTTNSLDLSTGSVFEVTPTSDVQVTLSNPADSGTVSGATLLLEGAAKSTYDIANAVYDDVSFSVASQDASPQSITFNDTGTKLYVLGFVNDTVYQYTLSTPYDVSTASYDSVSFSVSSQEATPRSVAFNSGGTKMYIAGNTNNTVYQYTLSTAFDLSTASYDSVSFSVASQETTTFGITFSTDGTKMYAVGLANDTIYQYTLSTAYDVSTASYDSVSLSVSSQDANPNSIFFNADGTILLMGGEGADAVYKYTLSTGFDLSTASYTGDSFSVVSQENAIAGVAVNSSGTKFYVVGSGSDTVHQYSMAPEATITYDTTIEWPSGIAPTSPAIGETDVVTFNTRDGGSTYQGVLAIDGAK